MAQALSRSAESQADLALKGPHWVCVGWRGDMDR